MIGRNVRVGTKLEKCGTLRSVLLTAKMNRKLTLKIPSFFLFGTNVAQCEVKPDITKAGNEDMYVRLDTICFRITPKGRKSGTLKINLL